MIKEMLDLPCDVPVSGADGEKTWRQLIAKAILYGAVKGNPVMIKELLDRTDGKVTVPISGENGKPLFSVTFQMLNSNTQEITEKLMSGEG